MTCREKLISDFPSLNHDEVFKCECPDAYFENAYNLCVSNAHNLCVSTGEHNCKKCWDQEYRMKTIAIEPESDAKTSIVNYNTPHILDSGARREFESGAVRDIHEGKGRCDLLPMDIVANYLENAVLFNIHDFQQTGDTIYLYSAIKEFVDYFDSCPFTMLLEVAIQFEEGAKKYGDSNWRKGIPVRCYIDSAVRHYLKFSRGDNDERHDRAFVWNILCAIWTCKHKPELNDYRKD